MTQYIVAVMLDSTLNVASTGPFRSRARADEVARRINEAGAWSDQEDGHATIIAQVVPLESVDDLLEACKDRRADEEEGL